jgi:hypothetical protein
MKIIISESQLRRLIKEYQDEIEEIDIEGTYLEKPNTDYYRKKDIGDTFANEYGNVFKDEPITRSDSYGLKFIPEGNNSYKIKFPINFGIKHFPSRVDSIDGGLYGNEYYGMEISAMKKTKGNIIKNVDEILDSWNISIQTEGEPTNRIHFIGGIPPIFMGTGLGYFIYQEFIKYLGWGSSTSNVSAESQKIWTKLINDPDFYTFYIGGKNLSRIFAIYKKTDKDIIKIIDDNFNDVDFIKFDQQLLNDYPELKRYQNN